MAMEHTLGPNKVNHYEEMAHPRAKQRTGGHSKGATRDAEDKSGMNHTDDDNV